MTITIFHNPACSTSRKVLDMIRASGEDTRMVKYPKHPPNRDELTPVYARHAAFAARVVAYAGGG
jgi:arsenate reductase